MTMYITLTMTEAVAGWLAILVMFRDLPVVEGVVVLALLGHAVTIKPLYIHSS